MSTETKTAKSSLQKLRNEIARLQQIVTLLEPYETALLEVEKQPTYCGGYIDFDYPSRNDVKKILLAFGGEWRKEAGSDHKSITYTRNEPLGSEIVRIWCGAPPPSCVVVAKTVVIPEKVVPEHTETKYEVVCSPNDNEVPNA